MNVTFCGHSKLYQPEHISKWLDIILPALIEGGAAKTLNYAKQQGKVVVQFPKLHEMSEQEGLEIVSMNDTAK